MSKPVVAIVGRPNVGKSTLFNVLAGSTISIVKDTPGVTRDRIYADCTWLNNNFTLIDTGGIEPDSKDIILAQMREQAQIAIDTADVIIFIVDVRQGLVDADSKVADMLRKSKKPVVLAVNKVDSMAKFGNDVYEFYNLGIGDPVPVSAASRLGLGELLDEDLSIGYRLNFNSIIDYIVLLAYLLTLLTHQKKRSRDFLRKCLRELEKLESAVGVDTYMMIVGSGDRQKYGFIEGFIDGYGRKR